MIRFLQTPGPALKIVLSAILVVICGSMVVTLIPGFGSNLGLGGPAQGVVATVGGQQVTTVEVQREARQMLKQQFPQGGAQEAMLWPAGNGGLTCRLLFDNVWLRCRKISCQAAAVLLRVFMRSYHLWRSTMLQGRRCPEC